MDIRELGTRAWILFIPFIILLLCLIVILPSLVEKVEPITKIAYTLFGFSIGLVFSELKWWRKFSDTPKKNETEPLSSTEN